MKMSGQTDTWVMLVYDKKYCPQTKNRPKYNSKLFFESKANNIYIKYINHRVYFALPIVIQ